MDNNSYAQINYNPYDLEDVSVTEVEYQKKVREEQTSEGQPNMFGDTEYRVDEKVENLEIDSKQETETKSSVNVEQNLENLAAELAETVEEKESPIYNDDTEQTFLEKGQKNFKNDLNIKQSDQEESGSQHQNSSEENNFSQTQIHLTEVSEEIRDLFKQHVESERDIQRTLRRLENKFNDEILNGENRDSSVKTMYKELTEYKAGIVEKVLKNVLYDIVDIRETMLSQVRYLREKKGIEEISLDELESYADDIGDILEKHDVMIYKGNIGDENVAVRQKIVRKVETEDDSLVKKVADSLGFGYEYGAKILYPEKISVYVKKK